MSELKIAVIGGGSTYTPELIEGFIKKEKELPVKEISLMDIDEKRLKIVGNFAKRMVAKKTKIKINLTNSQREAIKDSSYIITQFRVGQMKARDNDIKISNKYKVIGQETTGVGGFAKALRTIPVILNICRDIEELTPNSFLINFTNPSGIITETVSKYSKVKVIGLCNIPIGILKEICKIIKSSPEDISLDYVGLNHLNWLRKIFHKGEDITEKIIYKLRTPFDKSLIKKLKMIPCGYLNYYYNTDKILKDQLSSKKNRAQAVMEIEKKLLKIYQNQRIVEKPKLLEKRGGAYYSEAAVNLISAIYNDKNEVHIVDVKNSGAISELSDNVVVEVPSTINKDGAHPLKMKKLEPEIRGLIQLIKTYEELTVECGVKGNLDYGFLALLVHPLAPKNIITLNKLMKELVKINKKYLVQF